MSGPIPTELGDLAKLIWLNLNDNQLSGPIPEELGNLGSLQGLLLHDNAGLSGPLPGSFIDLDDLYDLRMGGTGLCAPTDAPFQTWLAAIVTKLGVVDCGPSDRDILLALYNATDGPNWTNNTNWLSDKPIGEWYGVRVDSQGRVIELRMAAFVEYEPGRFRQIGNGLNGVIPPELVSLSNLRVLELSANLLRGKIPPELGNLSRLTFLGLRSNLLTGTIPPELGNLAQLESLQLGSASLRNVNKLTGEIPSELGNLSRLRWLDLRYNDLFGPIPPELGKLTRLESLDLSNNLRLSGPIPPELGDLANLASLSLNYNQLSGPIPSELGNLANLRGLDLHINQLSGPIPAELGDLTRLDFLNLALNDLSGSVPQSFLSLTRLQRFHFGGNNGLCVPGTRPFGDWIAGIDLGGTIFKGSYCNEADLGMLEFFFESTNGQGWTNSTGWLDGPFLESWHGVGVDSLGRVTALDLSDNELAGTVPGNLGQLAQLEELRLDGNPSLSGHLPLSLSLADLSLDVFHYGDTNLCAPSDPSFRQWSNRIASYEGTEGECGPTTDRDILVALYEATDGPNWVNKTNWGTEAPLSTWVRSRCRW